MGELVIIIKNIKEPNDVGSGGIQNKYKGRYEKIFDILNEDALFVQWESAEEKLIGNNFYLEFDNQPDADKIEKIKKLKNIEIILKENYSIGGL